MIGKNQCYMCLWKQAQDSLVFKFAVELAQQHHYILIFHSIASLKEPCDGRKQRLDESLKLQQFYHEVEDEQHWIKDHTPLANSDDYGKSLQEVQNLQKKHQVIQVFIWARVLLISVRAVFL